MLRTILTCLNTGAIALTLSLAAPYPASAVDDYGLPSLTGSSQAITGEEYRLGRAWLRQFRARVPVWHDPITQNYVESLVTRLLPHSELGNTRTVVTLVDSRALNAFAVPGGVIGLNAGLFAFAEEEDAVASVVAHELGHLSQRHYSRGRDRAEQTQLPAMAAMLAGMLIAASGGGDAGIAAAMGSQAAFIQDQLAYSRRFEQEADRLGMQIMAQAGFDPNAMARMFYAMQRQASLQGGNPPEFLLTHPLTQGRISDAEARASQLTPVQSSTEEDPSYHMIRARALLRVHQRDPQQAATRLIQDQAPETARRYLDALIVARQGQTDAALNQLDALARELPDLAMLPVSAAEVAFQAGRYDNAIERSRRVLRLMPGQLPATLILGEALLQRDPNEAYRILRGLAERRPEDASIFTLLAEAAGRSGREAWGHLARAEQMQLTGDIQRAIRQLGVARQVAKQSGDSNAAARIERRREDFIGYRETMEKF